MQSKLAQLKEIIGDFNEQKEPLEQLTQEKNIYQEIKHSNDDKYVLYDINNCNIDHDNTNRFSKEEIQLHENNQLLDNNGDLEEQKM